MVKRLTNSTKRFLLRVGERVAESLMTNILVLVLTMLAAWLAHRATQ